MLNHISSNKSNNKLIPLLFMLPVLWMTTGMLWDGDGDMRLVPIILVLALVSIFLFRFEIIKENFKNSFWIKLLLVSGLFGSIAYKIYGFDSRELRATLSILILLLVTPRDFYTKKVMQWVLLAAASSCALYGYYYQLYVNFNRGSWPINAIPFATICGLVCITSLGLIVTHFKEKKMLVLLASLLLSVTALLLSQSRGPLIAIILIVFLLLLYVSFTRRKTLGVCILVCLSTLTLGISQVSLVQQRIEDTIREYHLIQKGIYGYSIGTRLEMVNIGAELWQKKPILGYGKDIKHEFDRLESEKRISPIFNRYISMTFHNGYIDKFVIYGLIGGAIFITFLLYPILLSRRYSIENGSALLWPPALFIAICNVSDAPFINAQAAIYYMYLIGFVIFMLNNENEET
ncbi:O-antigen ligase family protein [Vibrio genomosp. F10]|uniref:O-antigen ligase family protein n=1 Tax=Vibrio genomosp. F10 TaxID=723171 RepID=UPI00030E21C3|nr:O-antigen ligase family protein [Vibrio genomosp. F10]OEF04552.1 ligase [Vibrio genomosp. F10 str. 9ZB36]